MTESGFWFRYQNKELKSSIFCRAGHWDFAKGIWISRLLYTYQCYHFNIWSCFESVLHPLTFFKESVLSKDWVKAEFEMILSFNPLELYCHSGGAAGRLNWDINKTDDMSGREFLLSTFSKSLDSMNAFQFARKALKDLLLM